MAIRSEIFRMIISGACVEVVEGGIEGKENQEWLAGAESPTKHTNIYITAGVVAKHN
jgi:hypothetical protein